MATFSLHCNEMIYIKTYNLLQTPRSGNIKLRELSEIKKINNYMINPTIFYWFNRSGPLSCNHKNA